MLLKSFIVGCTILLIAIGYSAYTILVPVSVSSDQIFIVEKGDGVGEISKNLKAQGYIRSDTMFNLYVFASGARKNLQAGRYDLSGKVAMADIVRRMRKGDVVATDREIKIIEGWSIDDIAEYFKKEGLVQSRQELLTIMYDSSQWAALIDPAGSFLREALEGKKSLEGFLFPDTYRIGFDASSEEILSLMLKNFVKKIGPYYDEAQQQGKTLFQLVTMASLIEKEVAKSEDRKIVSGILWKRFLAGYPLQVDATIVYLTGKNTTEITQADLWIDSPYNTYRNPGLPPGPIANPGVDAIEAALHPEKSPFWFYLSAPDGATIFSRTFAEHKQAKAKYLK